MAWEWACEVIGGDLRPFGSLGVEVEIIIEVAVIDLANALIMMDGYFVFAVVIEGDISDSGFEFVAGIADVCSEAEVVKEVLLGWTPTDDKIFQCG